MFGFLEQWIYGFKHVDLVLEKDSFLPGECVKGKIFIKAGKGSHRINRVECDLILIDNNEKEEQPVEIATTILMAKTLESDEEVSLPFSYTLPETLKSADDGFAYKFHTRLILNNTVKHVDHDDIVITKEENGQAE